MTVTIDISIAAEGWSGMSDIDGLAQRSVAAAADEGGLDPAIPAELSILLCDDATIRTLNRTWRGKDKATNVLSFPSASKSGLEGPTLLGDIAVAFETTAREAREEHKSFDAHLSHLLVHGVLHLLDQDHGDEASATLMEGAERRAMACLGYPDPYAGTEPDSTGA